MDDGHVLFLSPVTGCVWSACLLIYGRLLGRVAWVITGEHERTERMTRRNVSGNTPCWRGWRPVSGDRSAGG